MKAITRLVISLVLLFVFLSSTLPCGPGYVTPLFDTTSAPEDPYTDFVAGKLGIVKPTFHRTVLYAAYRYVNGGGLNAAEQQAMIDVWRADFDNKDFVDNSVDEAVKAWIERRSDVVGKDEKVPEIYAERAYGGYEFFPNCTKNAFETATETLADRASAHGPSDPNVIDWVKAQDEVFANCASGKQTPDAVQPGAPDWLQKDRAYQMAAASFYALDYNEAKRRFAEIAQDTDSPWAETADYLVARTLMRQASLNKNVEKAAPLYDEAEQRLERFTSLTGKFSNSADKMLGLIKYRRHPRERVAELARHLSGSGNDNFRQDVIDYNWLLDKFASETLAEEEKRKTDEKTKGLPLCTSIAVNAPCKPAPQASPTPNKHASELELSLYTNEKSYQIYVKEDASDIDALAAAEKAVGMPLTDQQKEQVRSLRQSAYAARFKDARQPDYEGGYWGEEKMTPSLLPDFLKQDELTAWLFVYQMSGPEAYLYSLNQFKSTGSPLWLMTAIAKADKSSAGLPRLMEAANNTSSTSPAFTTIAYHHARLLLEQGKQSGARKIIDDMLGASDLPVSAHNSFLELKLHVVETLEDWLKYSLKKPYAFDFDGDVGTVDRFIADQKSWYTPENYPDQTREQYEATVEENFKEEKMWQDREMFDESTIEAMNQLFPRTTLIDVERSPALPDYMRDRFAVAIWTRAYLLDDMATLLNITPEVIRFHPEFEPLLTKIATAPTQPAKDAAALYFVLKNPLLSPYLESGVGKTDNEQDAWSSDDWWCAPYDTEYDDATGAEVPKALPSRPAFLMAAQAKMAQDERKRLKDIGDAPKFLGDRVIAWAKRSPLDKRVPEALYIMINANGWTKYGCGNNEELKDEMVKYLKLHYPNSEWTAKLKQDESENQ
jgi:hypothetical protein